MMTLSENRPRPGKSQNFHFQKNPEIFRKHIFSEKVFGILKKYFLIGIFFLTRYGHVLCKNDSLVNPQASQQTMARRTVNENNAFYRISGF